MSKGKEKKARRRPDPLSDDFFEERRAELSRRVGKKRYAHVMGVVAAAEGMARAYGVDVRRARLAALLHDWDKSYKPDEIRSRARVLGVDQAVHPEMMGDMTALLHGPTAAAALAVEHPDIPPDVLTAVHRHTTGSEHMSELDMIIYVADMLEPGRDYDGLDELRAHVGKIPLEDLFLESFVHVMQMLVSRGKLLYPPTVGVYNHYLRRHRARVAEAHAQAGQAKR